MNFPKIALRGDSTLEGGNKIINKLISLGASNPNDIRGYGSGYYFIDYYGNIDTEMYLPIGYKLISHISELKSTKLFKLL